MSALRSSWVPTDRKLAGRVSKQTTEDECIPQTGELVHAAESMRQDVFRLPVSPEPVSRGWPKENAC